MNDPLNAVRAIMEAPEDVSLPGDMAGPDGDFSTHMGDREGPLGDMPEPPPIEAYGDGPDGPGDPDLPPPEAICARFPLNDYGNGQRYVTHFGQDVICVPRVGWFTWTGQRWHKDDDAIATRRKAQAIGELIAKETAWLFGSEEDEAELAAAEPHRALISEVEALPVGERTADQKRDLQAARLAVAQADQIMERRKSLIGQRLTHAKNAGNSGQMTNMMAEAAITLSRRHEQLDCGPLLVNTESGVLAFGSEVDEHEAAWVRPGKAAPKRAFVLLIPHDRGQLLTKMVPVTYDPAARAPLWDAFLERVQPDAGMRSFIQRWFGLSMTALTGEQKLAFFYGAGANGKSVMVDLMGRIMGDYAATAKIESLTGKNRRSGGDATPDLIHLFGARFVRTSEPEEGERLQEGMIKQLTGGEKILARALNTDFIEFLPEFKLTISGNHKPDIRGTDDGIWRRVMLVPFDVQIPKEERDPLMGQKLWAERSGILNWLVAGLLDYLQNGLQEPDQVLDATREYREDSDPIGTFLESCCVVSGDPAKFVTSRDLGEAFNVWMVERGEGGWQPATVARRLKEKAERWRSPSTGASFKAVKNNTMRYVGIEFTDMFGKRFRDMPRDQQGRPIFGRRVDE